MVFYIIEQLFHIVDCFRRGCLISFSAQTFSPSETRQKVGVDARTADCDNPRNPEGASDAEVAIWATGYRLAPAARPDLCPERRTVQRGPFRAGCRLLRWERCRPYGIDDQRRPSRSTVGKSLAILPAWTRAAVPPSPQRAGGSAARSALVRHKPRRHLSVYIPETFSHHFRLNFHHRF